MAVNWNGDTVYWSGMPQTASLFCIFTLLLSSLRYLYQPLFLSVSAVNCAQLYFPMPLCTPIAKPFTPTCPSTPGFTFTTTHSKYAVGDTQGFLSLAFSRSLFVSLWQWVMKSLLLLWESRFLFQVESAFYSKSWPSTPALQHSLFNFFVLS